MTEDEANALAGLTHTQRRLVLLELLELEREAARQAVRRAPNAPNAARIDADADAVQCAWQRAERARQAFEDATRAVDYAVLQLANSRGDGPLSGRA